MRIISTLTLLFLLVPACPLGASLNWVEDSFEDFADGVLDSSGQNLYVTRGGRITTANRFDLNGDGLQDLVFNSAHDFVTAPKPTVYLLPGNRTAAERPGIFQFSGQPIMGLSWT